MKEVSVCEYYLLVPFDHFRSSEHDHSIGIIHGDVILLWPPRGLLVIVLRM